ncbi:unnamed protein product [Caenorhabditis angaria]|uniref:Uncharacterized protein n=1 Tax=Caenorhabditis angaria TaxID=860376 RepID=A0A9P1N9U2_9PELO|nr:unnamed protein product [Caenorhabditis angaria]
MFKGVDKLASNSTPQSTISLRFVEILQLLPMEDDRAIAENQTTSKPIAVTVGRTTRNHTASEVSTTSTIPAPDEEDFWNGINQ